jgi:hypothetical protein
MRLQNPLDLFDFDIRIKQMLKDIADNHDVEEIIGEFGISQCAIIKGNAVGNRLAAAQNIAPRHGKPVPLRNF